LIGLQRRLHGIDDIGLNSRLFSSVQLNRNNSFYDFLLKICELVYENLLPTEDPGKSKFRDFLQDDKKMPALFEEFVRNFYRLEALDCKVGREDIAWHAIIDEKDKIYLPKMQTDISIERGDSKTIIDTKFYREALVTHYGQEKIQSGHLYQMHAYLTHLEKKGGINSNCSGILLYPTVETDWCIPMRIFDKYSVTVCTVNLNQEWVKIHKDLMTILERTLTPPIC
jgi:5-methylcytosine-specific restriction enzyme subunit McrC